MKALLVSSLLLASTIASAEPSFEVLDRGTAIEVIAHDVKATKTVVNPARSRLEIEVTGTPHAVPLVPTSSAVKVVEFDSQTHTLSVKLPLDRPQVKQMAKFAQAIQVGDDLHMLFPRDLPAEGAKVVLPEPTVPAALEARAKAMAPVITPATPFGPQKPRDTKAPVTAAATTIPGPTEAAAETKEPAKKKDDKFLADDEPSSNASTYAMLGLGALGLGAWMLKKRRTKTAGAPASSIEMIAQRSLGSKAKVVWLAAGGREMVVAVTPQSVRMLGQWKKNDGTPASSSINAMTALPEATAFEHRPRERAVTNSPVAGILKLRERMPTSNKVEVELLDEEIATGDLDADAIWAKEILAASGGRR